LATLLSHGERKPCVHNPCPVLRCIHPFDRRLQLCCGILCGDLGEGIRGSEANRWECRDLPCRRMCVDL
jgi:hypothetical protein